MPASLTTLAHTATSDLMISANWPSGALFGSQPMFDIDWLFANWGRTLGQDRFYPPPKGMPGPPSPGPAAARQG